MSTSGGFPNEHVTIHIGYNTKHFSADETGRMPRTVDKIGGPFETDVSWQVWNRTDHDIEIHIHGFRQGAALKCPVAGGDLLNCEYASLRAIAPNSFAMVRTAIVRRGDSGIYDYQLDARASGTTDWDTIDPELQIDNHYRWLWPVLVTAAAAIAGALVWWWVNR